MATYYVAGQTGSDSNSGTTETAPLKTMPSGAGTGDTIYCSEQIRDSSGNAATITYTNKSNMVIAQWPGKPQAVFCGDSTPLATSGWSASSNAWTKTIATGMTIGAVVYKWDVLTTSTGQHYGFLQSDTAANVQAGTGSTGKYNYNSATGLLTVYLGGDNPNTSGYAVIYCRDDSVPAAIKFAGGTRNTVTGVNFRLYPVTSGQTGWGVMFNPSTYGRVENCRADSMGIHAFGTLGGGDCSYCSITNCQVYDVRPDGSGYVFFQENAYGTLTGCRMSNCYVGCSRWRGLDAAPLTGLSSNTQAGVAMHSDTGTTVTDCIITGCTFRSFTDDYGAEPFGASQAVAPTDGWDFNTYPIKADLCRFVGWTFMRHLRYAAYRRCIIDLVNCGPSGQCTSAYALSAASGTILESCLVLLDSTTGGFVALTGATNAVGADLRFLNCSIFDRNTSLTDQRYMFSLAFSSNGFVRARGCVCAYAPTSGSPTYMRLFAADDTVPAANHDFMDNAYFVQGGVYSSNTSYDSQSEFSSAIDTRAKFLSTCPFQTSGTNLIPIAGGELQSLSRAGTDAIPKDGVDQYAYRGYFGAHQGPFHSTGSSRSA